MDDDIHRTLDASYHERNKTIPTNRDNPINTL